LGYFLKGNFEFFKVYKKTAMPFKALPLFSKFIHQTLLGSLDYF
jgi:hypothetical protein